MEPWNSQVILPLLVYLVAVALLSASSIHASDHATNGGVGRRLLLGLKEKPRGTNLTFDCSPSGACVPCLYSEKSQNSRSIIEISHENANAHVMLHDTVSNKHRSLLDDSSTLEDGSQAYITYRSCITPVNEEKLSVVGFEVR
ncbi:hypothetical protein GH714_027440 [Hevea brasiliensis]|uniref:Uncharacterized protein n=1 Tax=Hevea brasiliensis TaxID=3981 RepID=A0A6A6NJI5_HEVBR|nr:hypothetical protein GH714_027440 [Hevea brasiliensis]